MATGTSGSRYPLLVLLCALCASPGSRSPVAAAAGRSCADTRQVYAEMGYSTGTAPQTQISGKSPQLGGREGRKEEEGRKEGRMNTT